MRSIAAQATGATGRTRRERVRRGRPNGQLYAGEKVQRTTRAAVLRWFGIARACGFLAGQPAMLRAAGVILSLGGDPRPRSGLELSRMARVSESTIWRTVTALEAYGFAPVERFERDGEVMVADVRGRPVAFRRYGINRMVAGFRMALLSRLTYPRSKGEAARGVVRVRERGESVRTSPIVSQTPANQGFAPAGHGRKQASQDREVASDWALSARMARALRDRIGGK